jgi:hypothetical protein
LRSSVAASSTSPLACSSASAHLEEGVDGTHGRIARVKQSMGTSEREAKGERCCGRFCVLLHRRAGPLTERLDESGARLRRHQAACSEARQRGRHKHWSTPHGQREERGRSSEHRG